MHVLVMEYIEGPAIDDKEKLLAGGYDLEEIGIKLIDNYIKQVMEDGFFHADPTRKCKDPGWQDCMDRLWE